MCNVYGKSLDAAKEGLGAQRCYERDPPASLSLYRQQEVQQFAAGTKVSTSGSKAAARQRGLPSPGWEGARTSTTSGSSQEVREGQSEEAEKSISCDLRSHDTTNNIYLFSKTLLHAGS